MSHLRITRILLVAAALVVAAPSFSQKAFVDVGKQPPITVLIGSTPWYPAFEKVVGTYEEQTGNKIKLDVTPFASILEKARNATRSGQSPYDLMMLDTQWTIEFYEGGFLSPLKDIDASFDLPKEVLSYGDSGYWNAQKRWRTADGGKLMAYTVLGNVQLLYYRADVLKQAGLAPPKTWDDVLTACTKLNDPPKTYGFVARGEKGNGIRYDWQSVMLAEGASVVKDPAAGDYTVTINNAAGESCARPLHQPAEALRAAESRLARSGRRDPASRDRQGGARRCRDRGFRELRGSEQVGRCRQARDGAAAERARRRARRRDRQLECRRSEERAGCAEEGGARVLALVPDLRRAARVCAGRRHPESQ